jgi:hypothetical protein
MTCDSREILKHLKSKKDEKVIHIHDDQQLKFSGILHPYITFHKVN